MREVTTKELLSRELMRLRRRLAKAEDQVAECRKTESKLQHVASELEAVFRALPDLYFRMGSDGTILDYKAGRAADLYISPEQFLGKRMQDILPRDVANRVDEAIRKVREEGTTQTIEYSLPVGGRIQHFEARLMPLAESEIVAVVRNTTDRKQIEDALRKSEEKYRNLVETTSDWVWEVDENGVYTYVSPQVKELLGYEPEEVLGKTPFELMPPDEAKRVAAIFRPIQSRHRPFRSLENINRRKDGRLVVLETGGVPLFDNEGRFYGYRGIDRDITARKEAEKLQEEFLSLISHDLRAPLTVVLGQAEWLRRVLSERGEAREADSAKAIKKNAERMSSMIEDLVESTRLETGQMRMHKRPTDLWELISDLLGRVGTIEDRRRLHFEAPQALPKVSVDANRIERALVNLITNALKYSDPGTPVTVRLAVVGSDILVSVADQGPGIPPGRAAISLRAVLSGKDRQKS